MNLYISILSIFTLSLSISAVNAQDNDISRELSTAPLKGDIVSIDEETYISDRYHKKTGELRDLYQYRYDKKGELVEKYHSKSFYDTNSERWTYNKFGEIKSYYEQSRTRRKFLSGGTTYRTYIYYNYDRKGRLKKKKTKDSSFRRRSETSIEFIYYYYKAPSFKLVRKLLNRFRLYYNYRTDLIFDKNGFLVEKTKYRNKYRYVRSEHYSQTIYEEVSKYQRILKEYNSEDSLIYQAECRYDAEGRQTDKIPLELQSNKLYYKYHWEYDSMGRETKEVKYTNPDINHPSSLVKTFKYDSLGQIKEETEKQVVEYHKKEITDYRTTYTYNAKNQLVEESFYNKGPRVYLREFSYDERGNLIKEIKYRSIDHVYTKTWKYIYDNTGNWIEKVEYEDGNAKYCTTRNIVYRE